MKQNMKTGSALLFLATSIHCGVDGFSLSMTTGRNAVDTANSRRAFISSSAAAIGAIGIATQPNPSNAAATKEILNLPSGIKYAVLKESPANKPTTPYKGDIVAVEYTGYLANGQIFDATHAEGKGNALLFKLGTGAVIPGLDDMVAAMTVGQKVQAIIPPKLAYGDKGKTQDTIFAIMKLIACYAILLY